MNYVNNSTAAVSSIDAEGSTAVSPGTKTLKEFDLYMIGDNHFMGAVAFLWNMAGSFFLRSSVADTVMFIVARVVC